MTGFLTTETVNGCKKYGAANYFAKPFDIKKLKTVLQGLLADKH